VIPSLYISHSRETDDFEKRLAIEVHLNCIHRTYKMKLNTEPSIGASHQISVHFGIAVSEKKIFRN
jgi:hypothetical protein